MIAMIVVLNIWTNSLNHMRIWLTIPNCLEDEGYGDYVYLNINGDGTIEHFENMKKLIEEYFEKVSNKE